MHCQTCGKEISSDYQFCPFCGYAVDRFSLSVESKKPTTSFGANPSHTQRDKAGTTTDDSSDKFLALIAVILLIVYFPVGLLFMWITKSFTKATRWTVTILFIVAAVLGFLVIILWTSSPGYIM